VGRVPRGSSVGGWLWPAGPGLRAAGPGLWPAGPAEGSLADVIRLRTGWLLPAPADVAADSLQAGRRGTGADLSADIADIAELLLLAVHPAAPAALAHIAVRAQERPVQIVLTLTPGHGDRAVGDRTAAEPALRELAVALGVGMRTDFFGRQWQVRLALLPG